MRIFIIGMVMIALLTVMAMFPPQAELSTEKVVVPMRVYSGDTLSSVCSRAALEHGDVRDDLRAIVNDTRLHNNLPENDLIQPGEIILVELEVAKEIGK